MEVSFQKFLDRLKKLPSRSKEELHIWADLAELKCLVNVDNQLSQADFLDDIEERQEDLGEGYIDDVEEQRAGRSSPGERDDKNFQFAEDCFKIVEQRVIAFGTYYPFKISEDNKEIIIDGELTYHNKIYIFLLLCANLNYAGAFQSSLTSSFELMCLEVLRNYLPDYAEVHLFGSSNTENKGEQDKVSLLFDKIVQLGTKLRERIHVTRESFSKYDKGDAGLDLVGWVPSNDGLTHFPIFFGQCACTHDWVQKQHSSSYNVWCQLISLSTYPINLIFVPYSLRDASGNWFRGQKIHQSVMVDRNRIIHHFRNAEQKFRDFTSYKIIEEIVKLKESIY